MATRTVTDQATLDQALADKVATIYIKSDPGVWLSVTDSGSSRVEAWESSSVEARGSSRVEAWGSSRVEAWESSSVEAWESSSVVAWGSSSVEAWDSSRVEAWESSSVEAWGSSRVEAWDSSRVEARESSSVVAWGSSRVVAWDSSSVEAWESSSVEAGKYVAIHLHSTRAALTGGVIIDLTAIDETDPQQWADLHLRAADGTRTVYKAVDQDYNAGHHYGLTAYPIGGTVTAPDWQATRSCGHGLHFSPSPSGTRSYYTGDGEPRFLECTIDLSESVPLGDKIKARSCVVVREVDVHGDPVTS